MPKSANGQEMNPKADGVFAVVLAAGLSRRMGQPKQLLASTDGQPLIRCVASEAIASCVEGVLVVVPEEVAGMKEALMELPVRLLVNPLAGEGLSTSVHVAICELERRDAAAGVFLLGDQPSVRVDYINQVVQAFIQLNGNIVQAKYLDRFGHPVLFSKTLFPELLMCVGDVGGRDVIVRHRDERVAVSINELSPRDIDTQEDYRAFLTAGSYCTF